MLALILSFIVILPLILSWGDMFLVAYNSVCKQSESYNIFEKLILGFVAILIPLSIWSLWLPSNHVFLIASYLPCIIYWVFRRKHLLQSFREFSIKVKNSNKIGLAIAALLILSFLSASTWIGSVFDSAYYHYQHIRWNEEFAAVPGLANLDHRFAFNSNYLLLSAIFSLRFVFGEPIYGLIFATNSVLIAWLTVQVFNSKFEIKRVILFTTYGLCHMMSINFSYNTSTDLLPNMIAFYIIASVILNPNMGNSKRLLLIVAPALLITLKLSMAPFALFSLYAIYSLFKEKQYTAIMFSTILSVILVGLWLVRNVIISGYLIFPVASIDLFNFDWKLPANILTNEIKYIKEVGDRYFEIATHDFRVKYRDPFWTNIVHLCVYIITIICLIIGVYNIVKKRKLISPLYIIAFIVLIITLILWFDKGPDARFIPYILAGTIAMGLTSIWIEKKASAKVFAVIIFASYCSIFVLYNFRRVKDGFKQVKHSHYENKRPSSNSFIKPYPIFELWVNNGYIDKDKYYDTMRLDNGLPLYIVKDGPLTYDVLPATSPITTESKTCDYTLLQTRGKCLQDGFKLKSKN